MKYFIVVGEASGDQHAADLMRALLQCDSRADFAYMGGPAMRKVGGACVVCSEEMAFMGFVEVIRNISTIRTNARRVQQAIRDYDPDVVICVDYAGFCFRYILPFVRQELPHSRIAYYIPPKVWAWKKHRIRTLRSHTDLVLTIFPFEVDYFAQEELQQAVYVGNPSMEQVQRYLSANVGRHPDSIAAELPSRYIALLCGSRRSELKANLPTMLRVAQRFPHYRVVIAGAPGLRPEDYAPYLHGTGTEVELRFGDTYGVVRGAVVALVTSGTATLETALLGTPQVVAYAVRGGELANFVFKHFFSIPYISLVNLIADRCVVQECYGGRFRENVLYSALVPLLADTPERATMLSGYDAVRTALSTEYPVAATAAQELLKLLKRP